MRSTKGTSHSGKTQTNQITTLNIPRTQPKHAASCRKHLSTRVRHNTTCLYRHSRKRNIERCVVLSQFAVETLQYPAY